MCALKTAALAAALLAAGPALAQAPAFEATGEVRFLGWGGTGSGAAFDQERIVGPSVNLTRRENGTWAGDVLGQDMDLQVTGNKASGPNVSLSYETKNGRTLVEGLFFGRRVRIELDKKHLRGRIGDCSLDLTRKHPSYLHGDMGCVPAGRAVPQSSRATIQLLGEAASDTPPLPQLAFALVGILPG